MTMSVAQFAALLEDLYQAETERLGVDRELLAVLTRIAERLDDEHDRRDEATP